jgi:hypothetical protein
MDIAGKDLGAAGDGDVQILEDVLPFILLVCETLVDAAYQLRIGGMADFLMLLDLPDDLSEERLSSSVLRIKDDFIAPGEDPRPQDMLQGAQVFILDTAYLLQDMLIIKNNG